MPGKKRKASGDLGPKAKKMKVEKLTKAAFEGNYSDVLAHADDDILDLKNSRGQTALYCAAHQNHAKIVKALVKKGADVDETEENGSSPLHVAAFNGNTAVVRALLEAGADAEAENNFGLTPLEEATDEGNTAVVTLLTKSINKKNAKKPAKKKPLKKSAAKKKTAKKKKAFDEEELDEMAEDLCTAAFEGDEDKVVELLEETTDILDMKNERGQTALYCASRQGHDEIVDLLIDRGADMDIVDSNKSTPLHAAAFFNHIKCVEILLDNDADPLKQNKYDVTPSQEAEEEGNKEVVKLMEEMLSKKMKKDKKKVKAPKLPKGALSVLDTPETWDESQAKPGEVNFVPVAKNSEQWKDVCDHIKKNGGPQFVKRVSKIEIVQNLDMWQRYAVKRLQMELKRPNKLNERRMWHGTAEPNVVSISTTGVNRSFAGKHATALGYGSYFADNLSYSMSGTYAAPNKKGEQRVFLARVLVGKEGQGNSSFKTAAPGFDSVRSPPPPAKAGNGMVVVYTDDQSYPEYIITFKKN